jgi:hypothetical protein
MDSPAANLPPAVLPYGHASAAPPAKVILARTFGLMIGLILGAVTGILAGVSVSGALELFIKTEHAFTIASRVTGVCFLLAAFACGLTSLNLRFKNLFLPQGYLVATGFCFLVFGLMFLLYQHE